MIVIAAICFLMSPIVAQDQCSHEPLSIERVSQYYDGGTLSVAITDSSGCLVEFCFDHRLQTETRDRVYLSPGGPLNPEARIADLDEEQSIIELLIDVIDHRYPRVVQAAIVEKEFKKVALTEQDVWYLLSEIRRRGVMENR